MTDTLIEQANSVHYAKILLDLRCLLHEIADDIEDEGDRVYFGSTNDADRLKDITDKIQDIEWGRVIKAGKRFDYYGELRAKNQAIATLTAENERYKEALTDIGIYGCGMLNQPMAIDGPEEDWLNSRIRRMEQVARAALKGKS